LVLALLISATLVPCLGLSANAKKAGIMVLQLLAIRKVRDFVSGVERVLRES
jgi:hypothetical protein